MSTVYPPALQPLVDRLRFRFRHHGREFGLTDDPALVRELAALGVRALPYKRARDSAHQEYEILLYEILLPSVDEVAAKSEQGSPQGDSPGGVK